MLTAAPTSSSAAAQRRRTLSALLLWRSMCRKDGALMWQLCGAAPSRAMSGCRQDAQNTASNRLCSRSSHLSGFANTKYHNIIEHD